MASCQVPTYMSWPERQARMFPPPVFSSFGLKPNGLCLLLSLGRLIMLKVVQGGSNAKALSLFSETRKVNQETTWTYLRLYSSEYDKSNGGPQRMPNLATLPLSLPILHRPQRTQTRMLRASLA